MSDDDDTIVSPERIAAAKRAWVAEGRQAFGTELFGGVVNGPDGKHAVIGLDHVAYADLEPLVGSEVTAKRFGWDDGDEADGGPDPTSGPGTGDGSLDLTGILSVRDIVYPDGRPGLAWEVGGQPADPETVCERTTEPPRTG